MSFLARILSQAALRTIQCEREAIREKGTPMKQPLAQKASSVLLACIVALGCSATVTTAALSSSLENPQTAYAAPAKKAGWKSSHGKWWYSHGNGACAKGWSKIGGTWYCFDKAGWMRTGWHNEGNTWYYLNPSGAMHVGWKAVNGTWYHFNASGKMARGWQAIDNSWYHFNNSGAMSSKTWVGDYYVREDGRMATDAWIGSYYVGADGRWIPGHGSSVNEVCWTPGGKKYHYNWCPTLSNSKHIMHGTVAEAGGRKPCKVCR